MKLKDMLHTVVPIINLLEYDMWTTNDHKLIHIAREIINNVRNGWWAWLQQKQENKPKELWQRWKKEEEKPSLLKLNTKKLDHGIHPISHANREKPADRFYFGGETKITVMGDLQLQN